MDTVERGSFAIVDICKSMDEATRLFNTVFFALTGTWADTFSFRRIVLGGLPEAQRRLAVGTPAMAIESGRIDHISHRARA